MFHSLGRRALACAAAVLLSAGLAAPAAAADEDGATRASAKKKAQLLLVHGYNGDADTSCSGVWNPAIKYYTTTGNLNKSQISTIGYYKGDTGCDKSVANAKTSTSIKTIAQELAGHIKKLNKNGQSVNVVAHSMGGLVTRVAILGTEQGWKGFPSGHLKVNNVATLSTPHKGIAKPKASNTRQWKQMTWGSGFMKKLHEKGNDLDGSWAKGIDWSLIGSTKDGTVKYKSAIDKGNYADQKYKYSDFGHKQIRKRQSGTHKLQYWHASGDHDPHQTEKGWEPLKTAYKAAKYKGDDLPR